MKFRMLVKNTVRESEWWENYDRFEINTLQEAELWCKNTVDSFNATLRPNESPRELIKVEIIGTGINGQEHQWRKTNSITIRDRSGSLYDTYQCSVCLITGRRYGLNDSITHDRQYMAKKYRFCKS